MTRPFKKPELHPCAGSALAHGVQRQYSYNRSSSRPLSGKAHTAGTYTASMASMLGNRGPLYSPPQTRRHNTTERGNSCSGNNCPPVSTSHLMAVHLGEVYPPSTCKDSRGILDGFFGAIERHILHSNPSGNVKIPSSLLHIGECPDVPEHLATFALRRSGSLHFRGRQDEAAEEQEGETAKPVKHKGHLGHVNDTNTRRGLSYPPFS
ncbi:uncharacterized protein LOC34620052 [Cyclospora cayetanensis]|uniref:Uncharacterized protein LOC34620052 n=2 Tax=Cyclospora cayetanensis TaxID=88456 RepID=A0A6P5WG13_9EIME|nr:uncharacterized protein LOC34620052 [Cyclospora cayetanensis]OEH79580.1 hypothetical protein cyc_03345 [Cyclospora cayetanensis]